jgi:hypothetical protein
VVGGDELGVQAVVGKRKDGCKVVPIRRLKMTKYWLIAVASVVGMYAVFIISIIWTHKKGAKM